MGNLVKSVSIFRIDDPEVELTDDQLEIEGYIHSVTEYDRNGNSIKEIDFNSDSTVDHQTEYEYNDNNLVIKVKQYLDDELLTEWKDTVRDENGRIIKEHLHYLDGSVDDIDFKYDDSDHLISIIQTNSDGEIDRQENFVYDQGKLVKEEVIDTGGKVTMLNTYSYSEEGIMEESIHERYEDGKTSRLVHEYNESGHRYKSLAYNHKNQLLEISRYVLDDNFRVVQIEDEDQHKKNLTLLEYDSLGNVISQVERAQNDEIISSVERKYSEDNMIMESKVYMAGQGIRPDQEYKLIYKYEYFN